MKIYFDHTLISFEYNILLVEQINPLLRAIILLIGDRMFKFCPIRKSRLNFDLETAKKVVKRLPSFYIK